MATAPPGELEKNIRRYFLGRILLAIAGFASIPLLNRVVGVEDYGQISLWMTVVIWTPLLFCGWLQQSAIRYDRQYELSLEFGEYIATTRLAQLWAAMATGCGTYLIVPFLTSASGVERLLIAAMAALMALNMVYTAVSQAKQRVSLIVWGDLARTVAPLVFFLVCLLVLGRLSRTVALGCFAAGILVANLILSTSIRDRSGRKGTYSPDILRRLAVFGLPMAIWACLSVTQILVGRFVLQLYGLREGLGVYTTFQDFLSKSATVLFMPVTYALHGQVMALWAEGQYGSARDAVRRCYMYQGVLGAAIALAVVGGQPILHRVLFGASVPGGQGAASHLVLIVTAAVILGNFSLVSHKGLEIGERTGTMAVLLALAVVINTVVSLALTPTMGPVGVAYGLLVANACYLAATYAFSSRYLRLTGEAA
jgi:O-antigen/teichoic acid export membrane protein